MSPTLLLIVTTLASFVIAAAGVALGLYLAGFFDARKVPVGQKSFGPVSLILLVLSGVCGWFFGRAVLAASWPLVALWAGLSFLVSVAYGYEQCPVMEDKRTVNERFGRLFGAFASAGRARSRRGETFDCPEFSAR